MKTQILDAINDKSNSINIATNLLKDGNIIAFPTETVYGIGSLIYDLTSVEKIYELKGRSKTNPLAAHISDISHTEYLCEYIPDDFYKLAEKFLPGPLSIVLKKNSSISDLVTGNLNTISIRMPDNDICLDLIKSAGQPIAATSANFSGKPASTKLKHVLDDFDGKIPAILDGGNCKYNIESTVLSLAEHHPTIIRPGAITQFEIEKLLGKKVYSADRTILLHSMANLKQKNKLNKKLFYNQLEIQDYIHQNTLEKFLILGNNVDKINNTEILELNQETFFDSLRYAESGNFDEVLILFDNNIKQNEALSFRINNLVNSQ